VTTPLAFARAYAQEFEGDLCEWLRIPSISTLPAHRSDVERAARWTADHLRAIGLDGRLIAGEGHPLAYGEWRGAPGRPTVLAYGHYDVQPADPLDLWSTPPFEPARRGGSLYARGAADNKGPIFTFFKAVESYLATGTTLPVNVKVLVEGEEESGGKMVESFIRSDPERAHADAALVLDSGMFASGVPAITMGLRGIVGAEVEVAGPARDLHSGLYGGTAPNPFLALARIIAGLVDSHGRILIPHFYDGVASPEPEERTAWSRLPFDEATFGRDEVGSAALIGEPGYTVLERLWARPALDVHGMPGGFTGEGIKTVIPARASAKISMRLVPHQHPEEIYEQFEAYVHHLTPPGARVAVRYLGSAPPVLVDPRAPAIAAARAALTETFDRDAILIRSGATVPIVADLVTRLRIPTVVTGWSLPDAGWHGPDEKIDLSHFHLGIEALIRFLERFGAFGMTQGR